jgi:nucleotide-binding universal stress UspA family protein
MPSHGYVAVVGIDFSDMSNKALDQALEVTNLRAGEVHVVYVEPEIPLDPMFAGAFQSAVTAESLLESVRQRASERLGVVQKEQGKLAVKRIVVHVRKGSAGDEIAQLAADLDADLVVVGSHGRRGVSRLVLGSVAERVSRLARCPVWIIRPKAHQGGEHIPRVPEAPGRHERRRAVVLAALGAPHPRARLQVRDHQHDRRLGAALRIDAGTRRLSLAGVGRM